MPMKWMKSAMIERRTATVDKKIILRHVLRHVQFFEEKFAHDATSFYLLHIMIHNLTLAGNGPYFALCLRELNFCELTH